MPVKLETETLRVIALFEKITHVHAKDCVITDKFVYFLVEPEKIGLAIGKNGSIIKEVRNALKRQVKVYRYYKDPADFIKNFLVSVKSVEVNHESVVVSINHKDRSLVIGRNGENIKILKEFLDRHFSIKNIKIR